LREGNPEELPGLSLIEAEGLEDVAILGGSH